MKKAFSCFLIFLASQVSAVVYQQPTPQFNPRVEIAAVYIEYNGKILLLHRQDNKSQGNKWGIPGGKVDKGETPLQAAIREVKEETGYDISKQAIENLGTVYIENEICKSWKDIQEVNITIDPKPVQTITLSGKIIYKAGRYTILKAS